MFLRQLFFGKVINTNAVNKVLCNNTKCINRKDIFDLLIQTKFFLKW